MTSEAEFRRRFAAAGRLAGSSPPADDPAEREALIQLSHDFRRACAALRDTLVGRGLPGYPVVSEPPGAPGDLRGFLLGCWTTDDEDDGRDGSGSTDQLSLHTFILLTSGVATEARWSPGQHAFAVTEPPRWLRLAVRRDPRRRFRLVSSRTPFDCGDLIDHLTLVARAGGRFYRYRSELFLVLHPGDHPEPWNRPAAPPVPGPSSRGGLRRPPGPPGDHARRPPAGP